MVDNYQICPYTGLRSFTEEESLYFKGREDDIDQATLQLQKNKFLMLTGASGDGKSSLVYAGIIPNARSGFLKSKYSPWCIADFRPERTPFRNLARAIARQLDIPAVDTVTAELNHGFSALVDLYKSSKRYIDTDSAEWQQADDKARNLMRREAANLVILVDQFEEFFTNPENYQHGAPSKDANLVLNLLLEAARIALDEDLPIYVIFTMRSDYIGQCAAFRGLPEYIGFSQFFVPRLNRNQLQQVIEEPAVLSGNSITRRLTERLIHDLTEGVDQLPILQHALNQIWVAADQGNAEMDLLHYAKVGGMPVEELPEEQVAAFETWFAALPADIKACYHAPSLQNVLDTHCNKLYEQAASYYTEKTGQAISNDDAKTIIKTAFTCLTKIDQGRAVRNRMTLQEITHILGRPGIDSAIAGQVLDIFREPGNTFIRPFINHDDADSLNLPATQVLDITHESLIRNWLYLGQWANEEFSNYTISLDFEQQLGRWVESGKSDSFLLSIGPLTYFENWFNKVKPNSWWIARYLPEDTDAATKHIRASETLENAESFLARSASKHVITRTIMRYGPKKIGLVFGAIGLLFLSTFGISSYLKRLNKNVLKSIHAETLQLAGNHKVTIDNNASLIAEQIKMGSLTIGEVINAIKDPIDKLNIANGIAVKLIYQGKVEPRAEILHSLAITDSLAAATVVPFSDPLKFSAYLNELNDFRANLELAYYYTAEPRVAELRKRNAARSAQLVLKLLREQPAGFTDIQNLTLALENGINYKVFSPQEIREILGHLSPLDGGLKTSWLQSNFQRDKLLLRGNSNYGFKFNGLYQELAYLYASTGETDKVLQCMDSLLANSQANFQGEYASGADNAANIAAVFYSSGNTGQLDAFVAGYCRRKSTNALDFYDRLLGRTLHSFTTAANLELLNFMGDKQNLNLQFITREQLNFFFSKYRNLIRATVQDARERNFLAALNWKNEGIAKSMNAEQPGPGEVPAKSCFDSAIYHYRQVSPEYLGETITIKGSGGTDELKQQRKFLFIFPDVRTAFAPLEPRPYYYYFNTDAFLQYILENNYFSLLYAEPEDLKALNAWLSDYHVKMFSPEGFMVYPAKDAVFERLAAELDQHRIPSGAETSILYMHLGRRAQLAGKADAMVRYFDKIDKGSLINLMAMSDFGRNVSNASFRFLAFAVMGYATANHFDKMQGLIETFKLPMNRSSLYAFAAKELLVQKGDAVLANRLIDSARVEMNRAKNVTTGQPNRATLAFALTMQDPAKNIAEANKLIKNLPGKMVAIQNSTRSFGFHGQLYNALQIEPDLTSDDDHAYFLWNALYGMGESSPDQDPSWNRFNNGYLLFQSRFILYVDENN